MIYTMNDIMYATGKSYHDIRHHLIKSRIKTNGRFVFEKQQFDEIVEYMRTHTKCGIPMKEPITPQQKWNQKSYLKRKHERENGKNR